MKRQDSKRGHRLDVKVFPSEGWGHPPPVSRHSLGQVSLAWCIQEHKAMQINSWRRNLKFY